MIYLPFEDPNRGFIPHLGGILPGTPPPTIVGNPHLRGGSFVGLPGYGVECAEAATNLLTDPYFPTLDNWDDLNFDNGETAAVGPQYAMDQDEFFYGLYIDVDNDEEGQSQDVTISDATEYTASVWVYVISGTLELEVDKGDTTMESIGTYATTGQWSRIVGTFTSTGTDCVFRLQSSGGAAEGYFWMPQLEEAAYETPSRVGAQPASCIYVPSPVSDAQTRWSIVCVVSPDWDHDAASGITRRVWNLFEDADSFVEVRYNESDDKWYLVSSESTESNTSSSASTHSRLDNIHIVVTCDGYNAYLYINATKSSALAIKAVNAITNFIIGAGTTAGANAFNGIIDDIALIEGTAIPEFRVKELYRQFKQSIPLHGLTDIME